MPGRMYRAALESSNRRNPNAQVRDRASVSRPDVPAYRYRSRKPRRGLQEPHQRRHRLDAQEMDCDAVDNALLHALQNPRVNIAGIRRADLLPLLDQLSPDRLSRQLRRLRDLGVIKRVAGTYRYYLTRIGRAATAALCRVTQTVIIPALA